MTLEYAKDFAFAFVVMGFCFATLFAIVAALVFALDWLGGPPAMLGGLFLLLCGICAWRIVSEANSTPSQ